MLKFHYAKIKFRAKLLDVNQIEKKNRKLFSKLDTNKFLYSFCSKTRRG